MTETETLTEATRQQIDALSITAGRPLIITDADEVLFAFMAGLERYLNREGFSFDWSSFAISGNVRRADGSVVPRDEVRGHLAIFFDRHTEELDPVEDAARVLLALSARAQIVVLSNLPAAQGAARQRALVRHGMDYPLIVNEGLKGPAVRLLADRAAAPTVFIDDIPHNHASVALAAPQVHRLHFVADPRLARLLPPADASHHRADRWPEARGFIEDRLFGG